MQDWLRTKLDHITQEYLGGAGLGLAYETLYLAYLECLVATTTPDAAPAVWKGWHEVCAKATPEGQEVTWLSCRTTSRKELADALQTFRHRFSAPKRRAARVSPKWAPVDPIDILDLLD